MPGRSRLAGDRSRLLSIEQVPEWLQFNRFVLSGYRPQLNVAGALATFPQLHNESVNVWSHFIPALYFIYMALHPPVTTWIVGFAQWSYVCIFVASTIYHLFMPCCRSRGGYVRLISCDVLGALLSITVSAYSFILYGYRCTPESTVTWCASLFGLSAMAVFLAIVSFEMTVAQRFMMFGVHCVLRLVLSQVILLPKVAAQGITPSYWYHTVSFFVILTGGLFNISRVPERWVNSRLLDYVGNSHNIWHYFCWQSCYMTMLGTVHDSLEWDATDCGW